MMLEVPCVPVGKHDRQRVIVIEWFAEGMKVENFNLRT